MTKYLYWAEYVPPERSGSIEFEDAEVLELIRAGGRELTEPDTNAGDYHLTTDHCRVLQAEYDRTGDKVYSELIAAILRSRNGIRVTWNWHANQ